MHKLQEAIDDGTQETDEDLWDSFIERFKTAFTNQNQKEEAYQKLCKLKQGESLDDFFAKFKQLAHEAGVPLDDKGTIETLKRAMNEPLTRAVIQSPDFNPNADIPWTFKQWEDQARMSHQKWLAASQYSRQKQGKTRTVQSLWTKAKPREKQPVWKKQNFWTTHHLPRRICHGGRRQ